MTLRVPGHVASRSARLGLLATLLAGGSLAAHRGPAPSTGVVSSLSAHPPAHRGLVLQPTDGRARVRVELGLDAAQPLRVYPSEGPSIGVRRVGATNAPSMHLEDGAIFYVGVQQGVDALLFAARAGVEELLVVRGPGADIAYDLDLPKGYGLRRSAVPGLVEIRDASATARLRLWVTRAWDAARREVPVELVIEGKTRVRLALREDAVTM